MPGSAAWLVVQSEAEPRRSLCCVAEVVELARTAVDAMILDDASNPAVERGRYFIGYNEAVDGYRHAYEAPVGKYGHRTEIRYSRSASHPPDPRCPECHPLPTAGADQ